MHGHRIPAIVGQTRCGGDRGARLPEADRPRVPRSVPHEQPREAEGEPMSEDLEFMRTPGLPIHRSTDVRVDLAVDGTAKVILVKGSKAEMESPDKLGTYRLW